MKDPLPILPFEKPVSGNIELPGSKSITNRALILAALCEQPVTLTGALFSEDTAIMVNALKALGLVVHADASNHTIQVTGCGGKIPHREARLYVGNAGTAARFLTAMLSLRPGGHYQLDGSEAMRKRPMSGLLDALSNHQAARFTHEAMPGHFPFRMETFGLGGGDLSVDAAASSQILSALLMVAPLASGEPLVVNLQGETVSHPFVDMTVDMMRQFGQIPESDSRGGPYEFRSGAYTVPADTYAVEPDATAASYFVALPWVVGGNLWLKGCDGIELQGDIRFLEVMGQLGGQFETDAGSLSVKYPTRSNQGLSQNFNAISDTFLTLAALAPLLDSPLTISGIAHTRKQETDRIHAMATELNKLGQGVSDTEDCLTVEPNLARLKALSTDKPIEIDTYHDHRVAMSFGVLGCHNLHGDGRPWLSIRNPSCCAKTFPDFFERLDSLRLWGLPEGRQQTRI